LPETAWSDLADGGHHFIELASEHDRHFQRHLPGRCRRLCIAASDTDLDPVDDGLTSNLADEEAYLIDNVKGTTTQCQ
jgi:hypothetical protein